MDYIICVGIFYTTFWYNVALSFHSQGLPQEAGWPGEPHGLRGRPGSCGCWQMINAWKDRHQSAARRNRRWTIIWSSHDPACKPEKSHLFTKSKYILNNTSKTYNLNILRSYNTNWTHFWHLHPSMSIFCPNCLFLSFHPALTALLVLCTEK